MRDLEPAGAIDVRCGSCETAGSLPIERDSLSNDFEGLVLPPPSNQCSLGWSLKGLLPLAPGKVVAAGGQIRTKCTPRGVHFVRIWPPAATTFPGASGNKPFKLHPKEHWFEGGGSTRPSKSLDSESRSIGRLPAVSQDPHRTSIAPAGSKSRIQRKSYTISSHEISNGTTEILWHSP